MTDKSESIIGKLPDTEFLINSKSEEYADVVSSLLKEYSEKFNHTYIPALRDYPKTPSNVILQRFKALRKRFENLIKDGSQLLEHADLSRSLQLELSFRLTEAEMVLSLLNDKGL